MVTNKHSEELNYGGLGCVKLDVNERIKLLRYKWKYGGKRLVSSYKKNVWYQENTTIRDNSYVRL
jgi:hypothetical protein